MKQIFSSIIIALCATILLFTSCKKTEEVEYKESWPTINEYIYRLMHEMYLHSEKVPEYKTMSQFESPSEALDALMYKTLDKWSFVANMKTLEEYFVDNQSVSYGFNITRDSNGNVVVCYVEKDSPAQKAGIQRGDILLEVDSYKLSEIKGFDALYPETNKDNVILGLMSKQGYSKRILLNADNVNTQTVPAYKIIVDANNRKYGYIMINSFVESTPEYISQAFSYFESQNIVELIVDLRYNGGGYVSGAEYLANMVIPMINNGKVMFQYQYNSRNPQYNSYVYFKKSNGMSFNKIFVLTTWQTASASELFINALKPYISVVQIGETSHGKPVGMNTFEYGDYAIVPITFATVNSKGEGYYYGGLKPDIEINEDFNTEIGAANDPFIMAATGTLSTKSLKSGFVPTSLDRIDKKGLRQIINLY